MAAVRWSQAKPTTSLLKETLAAWQKDKAPRLAAALAYYTAFSMAPLLLILIAVAGLVYGAKAAQGQVLGPLSNLIGPQAAHGLGGMAQHAAKLSSGILASVIGVVTLLLGASGVFGQLQDGMNTVWEVKADKKAGVMGFIKDRFLSFTMVAGIAFLLLVALVISSALAGVNAALSHMVPVLAVLFQILNVIVSLAVYMLVFALIFKLLPDADVKWHDVWIGAGITSVLFTVGQLLISWYLAKQGLASTYAEAGSVLVLLLWAYYSAQILLFGAEFTKVYAHRHGSRSGQQTPADVPHAAAASA